MPLINVAIDGPAGAGKSTVARKVAEKLGSNYKYVDTGAIYRALTYFFLQSECNLDSEDELISKINQVVINFNEDGSIVLNDVAISEEIRTMLVTKNVSLVSSYAGIRSFVFNLLQKIGETGGVVMDGRDIGTVVLPNAEVKIFLTASLETRAKRRALEMQNKFIDVDVKEIEKDIARRDLYDSSRTISPLKQADDAILLDTSNLSIEEVVSEIVNICHRHMTL